MTQFFIPIPKLWNGGEWCPRLAATLYSHIHFKSKSWAFSVPQETTLQDCQLPRSTGNVLNVGEEAIKNLNN